MNEIENDISISVTDEEMLDDIKTPEIEDGIRIKAPKKVSAFKKARIVIVTMICLLLAVLVAIYGSQINYDNVKRFFEKFKYNFSLSDKPNGQIDYPKSDDLLFTPYKGGVAILSNGRLSVFDDNGYRLSEIPVSMKNPIMTSSSKYILIYDLASTTLKICNSFEEAYSVTADNQITYASIGLGNNLSVVSYAEGYKNRVTVYDFTYSPVFSVYLFDRYITASETSPDNKYLAIGCIAANGINIESSVLVYKYGESGPFTEYSVGEETVHKLFYTKSGKIVLLTEKSLIYLDGNCNEIMKFDFHGKTVVGFDNTADYAAISLMTDGSRKTELSVFDSDGKTVFTDSDNNSKSLAIVEHSLWSFNGVSYSIYDFSEGKNKTYPIGENNYGCIVRGDKCCYLLGDSNGIIINGG